MFGVNHVLSECMRQMLVDCTLNKCCAMRVSDFPALPHHIVEVDVLVDDGAVTHVVVDKLALGDAFTFLVAVHGIAVRSVISKVVDERLEYLSL